MEHLRACKISVILSFLNWIKNEIIFYHISELMLPTLNQGNLMSAIIYVFMEKWEKVSILLVWRISRTMENKVLKLVMI